MTQEGTNITFFTVTDRLLIYQYWLMGNLGIMNFETVNNSG